MRPANARRLLGRTLSRLRASRRRTRHLKVVTQRIRDRRRRGEKVRVGFFVLYDSAFPALPLARLLKGDDRFDPVLVIIPDTLRGHDNMVEQMARSVRSLSDEGLPILSPWDETTGEFRDVADELDFVCLSNPYDELTHPNFSIAHLSTKSLLTFYIAYGFSLSRLTRKVISRPGFHSFWRIFVPTTSNRRDHRRFGTAARGAVRVTGYCKMDALASAEVAARPERPLVIIAPHHTVREWADGLELSTFLSFADLYRRLPLQYPDVDFVFRPHPLLFVHLREPDLWGPEKAEAYLDELASRPNVRIDESREYLSTFAASAALIHDSGSFSAEYLFTGRPALFLATDRDPAEQFGALGRACLEHHYRAETEEGIVQFIERVVRQGEDPMRAQRQHFARSQLMSHFPHASERIRDQLVSVLGQEGHV